MGGGDWERDWEREERLGREKRDWGERREIRRQIRREIRREIGREERFGERFAETDVWRQTHHTTQRDSMHWKWGNDS